MQIADGAVTNAKLAALAVTSDKIMLAAVTSAKIADNAIATAHIQDDAVTGAKIADNAIATVHIQDAAVTGAEIADNAIATVHIQDAAVTVLKLGMTGTASNATYLRGDGSWSYVAVADIANAVFTGTADLYKVSGTDPNTTVTVSSRITGGIFTGANITAVTAGSVLFSVSYVVPLTAAGSFTTITPANSTAALLPTDLYVVPTINNTGSYTGFDVFTTAEYANNNASFNYTTMFSS